MRMVAVSFRPIADLRELKQSDAVKLSLPLIAVPLCACASVLSAETTDVQYSSAYALFVASREGECVYSLTDTGMTHPADVTLKLRRDGYELTRGMEILYDSETPSLCIATAQKAARNAGFSNIRARLATAKDRFHGTP